MTETSPLALGRAASSRTLRDRSDDELADAARRAGHRRRRWWTCGSSTPAPTRRCRGTARRAASCRPPARGSPPATTTTSARADSFTEDGWLRTGDVATISPNGYVRLVDRTKDLVKSGGEWISSVELENAIMAHPKVAEAAVIGIPDEKWSERPLACVVPEDGEELDARRAQGVPRRARARSGGSRTTSRSSTRCPKTSVGKFSKKTLREQFAKARA